MDPLIGSALIGAGGSLLGGLFGSKKSTINAQRAEAQFDAQMDQTIQRRVADAKKAGLHPLFALGASPGASPTATISGQSDSGSLIGQGIGQAARHVAKALDPTTRAQLKNLESSSEANFAQAQLYRSQAKRAEVEANHTAVRTYAATETPAPKLLPLKGVAGDIIANPYSKPEEIEAVWGDAVGDFYNVTNWLGALLKKYGLKMPMGGFTPHSSRKRKFNWR